MYGQSHTEGSSGGDAEWTVRGDDSDSYERRLSAPPLPRPRPTPPLILRPQCEESPSQPSFPHGKYLTLTVAHVCHITRRFRRGKKKHVCMMNGVM